MMRPALAALSAAILLSACAEHALDGPPPAYADVDYDGWYDGYYGPFNGGFWGPHNRFYYDDGHNHFQPDRGGHFSHTAGAGMHAIHGHAPVHVGGGHAGGGGHR